MIWWSCEIYHDHIKIWDCLTFGSFLKWIFNRFWCIGNINLHGLSITSIHNSKQGKAVQLFSCDLQIHSTQTSWYQVDYLLNCESFFKYPLNSSMNCKPPNITLELRGYLKKRSQLNCWINFAVRLIINSLWTPYFVEIQNFPAFPHSHCMYWCDIFKTPSFSQCLPEQVTDGPLFSYVNLHKATDGEKVLWNQGTTLISDDPPNHL